MKAKAIKVYFEIGKKRTFAGAIEWPGWCRSGRDEESALQALMENGPRYADVLRSNDFGFQAPMHLSAFSTVERLEGDATTDFGAPSMAPSRDADPIDDAELQRFQLLLKAFWRAFDTAAKSARGRELRKGPRGGGREVEGITQHLLESDAGYLSALGWKLKLDAAVESGRMMKRIRKSMLEALTAAARGEISARGPRGGARWTPRYFIRRAAWHVLDHAWEIEDRIT